MNHSAPYQAQVYDNLVDTHDTIWETPCVHILLPHFRRTIRALDLPGKSVLDLACGTGVLLAEAGRLGASRLVGIDISAGMIESGVRQHIGDFEFHVADCSKPLDHLGVEPGTFDLITAGWLLHYPHTRNDMTGMWANIARYLKPGGVFVGIMHTYQLPPNQPAVADFTFGCRWKNIRPLAEGLGVKMTIEFNTNPRVEFENRQFERHVVEELAADAGLVDVEYLVPDVEVLREMGQEGELGFWQPLLFHPVNQIIRATKS
ncbi:S-adenosyl-L-methionine-dependent methyltransferase [Mycena galopus ATCC 62051]|nr:S-adenosyl-L-methionine-dependent methyltransferase [Mycena galopus ATCC 62051]